MPGFGHWSLIYIYISEKTNNDFIDNRLRIEKQSKMSEKIEKNEEPIKRDAKKAGKALREEELGRRVLDGSS